MRQDDPEGVVDCLVQLVKRRRAQLLDEGWYSRAEVDKALLDAMGQARPYPRETRDGAVEFIRADDDDRSVHISVRSYPIDGPGRQRFELMFITDQDFWDSMYSREILDRLEAIAATAAKAAERLRDSIDSGAGVAQGTLMIAMEEPS